MKEKKKHFRESSRDQSGVNAAFGLIKEAQL